MAFERARIFAALFVLASSSAAFAGEPSAADRESARAYMSEGRQKRDSGDLKAALRAFEAADAVMRVPTTAVEVARTQAMLGQLVEARDLALQTARAAPKPGEPPPFQEAHAIAQKLAEDLEVRIPSIRIILKGAGDTSSAVVTIDDVTIPNAAVGLPRRLNPGAHVVAVKLAGMDKRVTVQVLEREAKEVPLELGETNATPPNDGHITPVLVTNPHPNPIGGDHPAPTSSHGPWVGVGIATALVGVAGIAVGSVTGVMSISKTNQVKPLCGTGLNCPATLPDGSSTSQVLSTAQTLAMISDIGFIAGGVLAAAGVAFLIVGVTAKSPSENHASLRLHVGLGSVGLAGQF